MKWGEDMLYFKEIADYATYSGSEADFHFIYNANSGGGQAFLGGRFYDDGGDLVSPETLNGRVAVFECTYTNNVGAKVCVALADDKSKYEIKPRGNGSTSMKLGVGTERVAPSRVISAFMMLPPTCGVKTPSDLSLSILTSGNYWLQSMWIESVSYRADTTYTHLTLADCVFAGGINKDTVDGQGRYFKLDYVKRINDILDLSRIEGIYPEQIASAIKTFADIYAQNATFSYDACEQAIKVIMLQLAQYYPEYYSGISDPLPALKAILSQHEQAQASDNSIDENARVANGCNVLLYGVPGAGKSWTIAREYCSDETRMERLVFHPDYTYSDFVGQIMPKVEDGSVSYRFVPGPFTKLLKKAYEHPEVEYFLIIEEINRGNAPAIFGEVLQLLDRKAEPDASGYPVGTSEYGITNENVASIVYGDPDRLVRIPSNMSIIGTMNTSDQNVFTLDTAFQRRWNMRLIENTFEGHRFADNHILDTDVSWRQFCEAINREILKSNVRMTSSEDKRLGAFFITAADLVFNAAEDDETATEAVRIRARRDNRRFAEKVIKYLWDDAFKFSRENVFETNSFISLEQLIREFMDRRGNDRFRIFKEGMFNAIVDQADGTTIQ